ncbi:MAG: hypothetical protein ACK559_33040, partial [bacterium]
MLAGERPRDAVEHPPGDLEGLGAAEGAEEEGLVDAVPELRRQAAARGREHRVFGAARARARLGAEADAGRGLPLHFARAAVRGHHAHGGG